MKMFQKHTTFKVPNRNSSLCYNNCMNIGYARLGNGTRDSANHVEVLRSAGCTRIYADESSSSAPSTVQTGFVMALESARLGDTLVVSRLDRLGNSLRDLIAKLTELQARELSFVSLNEGIDTRSDEHGNFFSFVSMLAKSENHLRSAKIREGISSARARGRLGGRRKVLEGQKLENAMNLMEQRHIPVQEVADAFGVSRSTLYRYVRQEGKRKSGLPSAQIQHAMGAKQAPFQLDSAINEAEREDEMAQDLIPMAIIYDFDGTLAPGNMQEHQFIPDLGMEPQMFWNEVKSSVQQHEADETLTYMMVMLDKASQAKIPVRRRDFEGHGKRVTLFQGLEDWFDRIDAYGLSRGIQIEHYVLSSGNAEIIEGTGIAQNFTRIYASRFIFNENEVAVWPAHAVSPTNKTQYLFKINMGSLDLSDGNSIEVPSGNEKERIPFKNMIYVGDGLTDVPCFRLIKERCGLSIAVCEGEHTNASQKYRALFDLYCSGIVDAVLPANYNESEELCQIVYDRIRAVSAEEGYLVAKKHLDRRLETATWPFVGVSLDLEGVDNGVKELTRILNERGAQMAETLNLGTSAMKPQVAEMAETADLAAKAFEPQVAEMAKTANLAAKALEPHAADVARTVSLAANALETQGAQIREATRLATKALEPTTRGLAEAERMAKLVTEAFRPHSKAFSQMIRILSSSKFP